MAEKNDLDHERKILKENGFKIIGVVWKDKNGKIEKSGAFNTGANPKTWCVGADSTFITDSEGITWKGDGEGKNPEKIGLRKYEYECWPLL